MKSEYVKGGGLCLHAPSVVAQDFNEFLSYWMPHCTFIDDELERKRYLTSMYEQCVDLMNPPKYKTRQDEEHAEGMEQKVEEVTEQPAPKPRIRKATEKKE